MMTTENLVGKTVASVEYANPWDKGLTIIFTDGTKLEVNEEMQSGEINVVLNGQDVQSDWHKEQADSMY